MIHVIQIWRISIIHRRRLGSCPRAFIQDILKDQRRADCTKRKIEMILVIALALILALLLWIAFVPLNIIVNTAQNRYHISQTGTVTLSWHPNEQPGFKIKVFGFYVNQQPKQRQRKASAKIQKSKRPQSRKSLDAWAFLFKGILTSFKLRRLEGTIDFDDVFLNALLYPVFFLSNGGATRISTNFRGEYMLDIFAQGRIYSMLWTTIRFYFTKK